MKEIISEYGEMIVGIASAITFLAALVFAVFAKDGALSNLIFVWMNGGI